LSGTGCIIWRRLNASTCCVTFAARVGEEGKLFGSVTAADIQHQLEAQGYKFERRQIELVEPIKALGVYRVAIRLHADVKPEIKVWIIKQ
jgi:large subunit ribosomal protein L9